MHKTFIMFLYFFCVFNGFGKSTERQTILNLIEDAKKIQIEIDSKKLTPKIKSENEKIKERVVSQLDLEKMTKKTLGNHYSKLTKKQEKEFKEFFKKLMIQNLSKSSGGSSKKGSGFFDSYHVRVLEKVDQKDSQIIVKSILSRKGHENTEINYVFENAKIVDLFIDNESLTENFYEQFSEIILEEGVDGLLKLMEDRVKSSKS